MSDPRAIPDVAACDVISAAVQNEVRAALRTLATQNGPLSTIGCAGAFQRPPVNKSDRCMWAYITDGPFAIPGGPIDFSGHLYEWTEAIPGNNGFSEGTTTHADLGYAYNVDCGFVNIDSCCAFCMRCGPLVYDDAGTTREAWTFYGGNRPGELFRVRVEQSGGTDGDDTTQASWTYNVFNGVRQLATDLDPLIDPSFFRRPALGSISPATYGMASFTCESGASGFSLPWVNEVPNVEVCP